MSTVLSLCDHSGIMVQPWLDAGYECWIVDIKHSPGVTKEGNLVKVGADVNEWVLPSLDICMAFAFPPCTDLAVSGARWFKSKGLKKACDAVAIVSSCLDILEATKAPWMLENPVSRLSSFHKPDYIFNPCDYGGYLDPPGDAYTKKTCIWANDSFKMPEKKAVDPTEGSKMHLLPPSKDRASLRSLTPRGFAQAVFEANS